MSAGQEEEAREVLAHTIGTSNVEQVSELIKKEIELEENECSWGKVFGSQENFHALLVALTLGGLQGMSGIDTITYYSPKFFEAAGQVDSLAQNYSTFLMGIFKLSSIFLATCFIDSVGRRPLLLASFGGMCLSMAGTAVLYAMEAGSTPVLIGMILYVSSFSLGFGPVSWILPAEILPLSARAKGTSAAFFLLRGVSAISASAFLTVAQEISLAGVCGVFSFSAFIGLVFATICVPETKGRILETVHKCGDDDKKPLASS